MTLWFTAMAATALIAGASPPPAAYLAPCPSGISGGLDAGYERDSLVVGPLALYEAGQYGRYPGLDSVATVRAGHAVTLAVAPEDRTHAALLYDHRAFVHAGHGYTVADGDSAITLRGCTAPFTEYVGGFVLDGPRRVTLEAWVDGAAEPVRRVVPFGG